MENKKPSESVLKELDELTRRMFNICMKNNMAMVAGYSYELSRNEDGREFENI